MCPVDLRPIYGGGIEGFYLPFRIYPPARVGYSESVLGTEPKYGTTYPARKYECPLTIRFVRLFAQMATYIAIQFIMVLLVSADWVQTAVFTLTSAKMQHWHRMPIQIYPSGSR